MLWRRVVLSASTAGAVAVSVRDGYTAGDYDKSYAACQAPSADPLDGCPPGTILVDGTGAASSVSASATAYTILVLPGIYTEQLNVTQNTQITLLGQTVNPSNASSNTVTVYGKRANAGTYPDNVYTANLIIAPNYNASTTGYGPSGLPVDPSTPPGSPDFRAYNIDFVNDFAPQSAGPSLTLSTAYSYTSFYRCGFYSYQDSIFIGKLSPCADVAVGFIAWKGMNETDDGGMGTYDTNHFGCYIHNSRFTAENQTIFEDNKRKCFLGHNWNNGHRSVIMNSYMDDTIAGQGYKIWSGNVLPSTVLFGEYASYGDGFNASARALANVTKELSPPEVGPYKPAKVFDGHLSGIDSTLVK